MSRTYEWLNYGELDLALPGDAHHEVELSSPALVIGNPYDAAGVLSGGKQAVLAALVEMREFVETWPDDDDFATKALEAAIATMLWANTMTGDEDEARMLEHPSGDFENSARHQELRALVTDDAIIALADEVNDFVRSNLADVRDMDPGQVGHDFVLTRNHHGAGFWDRGLGEKGDRLTKNAHPYGELTWYQAEPGAEIESM